ncbi:MAG: sulfatase [Halioglobus sp.]
MNRLLFSLFLMALSSITAAATTQPNILILMAEDMSPRVGAFGDAVAHTPNLDALAQQGVRYTQMFTTAGVCAPSRAAHILGMHQIATGTQHMRSSSRPEGGYFSVPPEHVKAYPELLRAAGYYTYTGRKLDYQFSKAFPGTGPSSIWDKENAAQPGWRDRAANQPFFGFRSFMVTHESGVFPPVGWWPNSVTHLIMSVMRWFQADGDLPDVVSPQDVVLPPYYPDTPVVRADIARHYNNIAYMDGEVGEILAQLEADGLSDSTIVIWTTDHGDGLPRAKRDLYEAGIKVPMIIRWPEAYRPAGVAPGALDTRLLSFVDLAPTLLTLAGVSPPDYLHGESFGKNSSSVRDYIFASRDRIDEVPDRQRAVRDHRYKLIRSWNPQQAGGHPLEFRDNLDMVREMRSMFEAGELNAAQSAWFEAPGEERLFDIQNDPHELQDLSNDPEHKKVMVRLRTVLQEWQKRMGDLDVESESDMIARIMPEGERLTTPPPTATVRDQKVSLQGASPHYSLSYRVDGGPWKLYTDPVLLERSANIEAKAERYGWKESNTISVP